MHSLSSVVLSREAGGSTTVCTHHEISEIAGRVRCQQGRATKGERFYNSTYGSTANVRYVSPVSETVLKVSAIEIETVYVGP